jgi:hypothetical protein
MKCWLCAMNVADAEMITLLLPSFDMIASGPLPSNPPGSWDVELSQSPTDTRWPWSDMQPHSCVQSHPITRLGLRATDTMPQLGAFGLLTVVGHPEAFRLV